jgi:hypothetical protein
MVERSKIGARPGNNRSCVSNGKTLHAGIDGRTAQARRFHDLFAAFTEGFTEPDEATRSLARRAAGLACEAERLEGQLASGAEIDTSLYVTLSGHLSRMLDRLNELKPKQSTYWRSTEEIEREAYRKKLMSMSDEQFTALCIEHGVERTQHNDTQHNDTMSEEQRELCRRARDPDWHEQQRQAQAQRASTMNKEQDAEPDSTEANRLFAELML